MPDANLEMTKERAIEILLDYLEKQKIVWPKVDPHIFIDKVKEHQYCWEIPHTSKEYYETKNILKMPLGSGPYLIDKENGKIYLTGSAPYDWIQDFELMRSGQKPRWRWKELRNHYLNVQFEILPKTQLLSRIETVEYEEIRSFLESTFKEYKANNEDRESPKIRVLQHNEFRSKFLISFPLDSVIKDKADLELMKRDEVPVISLTYQRKFYHSNVGPLNEIKEWLKVNPQYKSTENYWIEEIETDPNKSFEEWNLKMCLEIRNTGTRTS